MLYVMTRILVCTNAPVARTLPLPEPGHRCAFGYVLHYSQRPRLGYCRSARTVSLAAMVNVPPGFQSVPGNRVTLLHDGAVCLPAMLEAIASAQREILLEMYWFASDATGRRFANALSERAAEGVRVCVTYDSVGSWGADRSMFDAMRAQGCEVYEYNPLLFWRLRLGNHRNHRKLLVVDGRVGMTGGVNLGDPWAALEDGGLGFRDDMIRVEGPAVAQMREIFLSAWQRPPQLRELLKVATRRDAPPRIPLPPSQVPEAVGDTRVLVLANDFWRSRRVIERAYLEQIRRAKRRVLIENSYFVPGFLVRRALAKAARNGARVDVVVAGASDIPAITYATRKLYGYMLRRGIRIFEWSQSVLHSKIAVVDSWCTVGSHNLDYRSWLYNLEINVSVDDERVADELATRIERDMRGSMLVDATRWRFRPLLQRLLEEFFYAFRRLF
jgi:cardiolipin synthase